MSETTEQTKESKTNKTRSLPWRQLEEEANKQLRSSVVLEAGGMLRNGGQGITDSVGDGGGSWWGTPQGHLLPPLRHDDGLHLPCPHSPPHSQAPLRTVLPHNTLLGRGPTAPW